MALQINSDLNVPGLLVLSGSNAEFPQNPSIGTIIIKDQVIYSYIKIGGLETWYPFASKTNSYIHTQGIPATTWTIQHNLQSSNIWYQVRDTEKNIVYVGSTTIDNNQFTLNFTAAIAGTVVVVAPDSIDVPEIRATSITVGNSGEVIVDTSGIRVNGEYVLTSDVINFQISSAISAHANEQGAHSYNKLADLPTLGTSSALDVAATGNASVGQVVKGNDTRLSDARTPLSHVHSTATSVDNGFMSSADKTKLDGVAANAAALGNSAPLVASVADVGTAVVAAREDHIHPAQTSVSGNAGTATKLSTARTINGVSFDGTANIVIAAEDATQRIASAEKGVANGVATLDSVGLVPTSQLPSYVDDVIEYSDLAGFPATGASGKIYVAIDTNKIYRWSGSTYIEISPVAGNADSATKLATARTIQLSGGVTGSVSFDGSSNVTITTTIPADSISLGVHTSGNYVAEVTPGSGIIVTDGTGEGSSPTVAVDGTASNVATKVVVRDINGDVAVSQVSATGVNINAVSLSKTATLTTVSVSAAMLASFATTEYGSGEFLIQASRGSARHVAKIYVVHDGTTAVGTKYLIPTSVDLFNVDVDIADGNVRVIVTPSDVASTTFKAAYTLLAV